jgi:RNA polymerase sigma-70 factor (ECF subfamily)
MKNDLDDLIIRLRQDDKEAFNVLFYMYAEKLQKFSMTFFSKAEEAEEIVQDVFIKIWVKRKNINNPASFNAYIYTIAKNMIFNSLKKNIYHKKFETFQYNTKQAFQNTTENDVLYQETRQRLESALEQLPAKRREVFLMSRRYGLKNKEIAEKLDISLKTVESHMSLSLKFLKEVFRIDLDN